jgi:hypothetical protein
MGIEQRLPQPLVSVDAHLAAAVMPLMDGHPAARPQDRPWKMSIHQTARTTSALRDGHRRAEICSHHAE